MIQKPRMISSLRYASTREEAYKAGVFFASVMGVSWAKDRVKDLFQALHTEGTNTAGGYLVPDELAESMIVVFERYGIFRRFARVVPTKRDLLRIPDRSSRNTNLAARAAGEGAAGTEDTVNFDAITLTPKKWVALTRMSSELDEDAAVYFGDQLLGEIGYAFAVAEDKAGFLGDESQTYAGIRGLVNALAAGSILTCAAANTWAAITAADVNNACALLPDVARDPAFYCNKAFFHAVLERLALAVGSQCGLHPITGEPTFNYYPVRFCAAMPAAGAASQISCYFGDLGVAATLCDRRDMRISRSNQAVLNGQSMFERDEIGLKGTERIDIVINDPGNATVGGSIVALKTHV